MGQSCCVGRSQLCGDYTQMMELRCATPCSTGDIYADRRACSRHVSFADNGPSLSLHSLNIPTSFATFKPQTDLEPTYDRSRRLVPAPHRTYPAVNQRVNMTLNQQQTPPPPAPPHQNQRPQRPNRNINCDYSLFNYDQDPDTNNDTAQPDLVSSNHVEGGPPEGQGQLPVANQNEETSVIVSQQINAIAPPEQCRH